ncbi:MAG: GNAT family N-acetyltransferase [Gammaproteobacteria bacterium]
MIREASPSDQAAILSVINDGASAYRGVIPPDRWREPYMSEDELRSEIEAGVQFSCFLEETDLVGVMGVQDRGAVVLIRHAYIRTQARRRGIGAQLLTALTQKTTKPVLIGTWKVATWAIDFYVKHGFAVLPDNQARTLLERYWRVPVRQMETSVVLANASFEAAMGVSSTGNQFVLE